MRSDRGAEHHGSPATGHDIGHLGLPRCGHPRLARHAPWVGGMLDHVMDPVEQHLWDELRAGMQQLKQEIGYNPREFKAMIGEHGPAEACRQLIKSPSPSTGFAKLWEHGKLDMSVEAVAVLPWYTTLFNDEDRQLARHRLLDYKFDVDGFLARRTGSPPRWYLEAAP